MFNIEPHTVRIFLPLALQCMDPIGEVGFMLLVKEVVNSGYDVIITVIVVPSQIRRIVRVINQCKAAVIHSNH